MTSVLICSIVAYRCYKSIINLTVVKVERGCCDVCGDRVTPSCCSSPCGSHSSEWGTGPPGRFAARRDGTVRGVGPCAPRGERPPASAPRRAGGVSDRGWRARGNGGRGARGWCAAKRARLLVRGSGRVPLARAALSRERRRPLDVDPMLTPESKPPAPFSRGPAVICFRINNLL